MTRAGVVLAVVLLVAVTAFVVALAYNGWLTP